ncbi:MAG: hypothetical protein AABZ60_24150 [Planctomycetota bacterium]
MKTTRLLWIGFCLLLICSCANSEQVFEYWQNGISEPQGVVDQLEREVERKHYFYDMDLRYDARVTYSENPSFMNTYY